MIFRRQVPAHFRSCETGGRGRCVSVGRSVRLCAWLASLISLASLAPLNFLSSLSSLRSLRFARLLSLALRSRSWRTTHTRTHFFFLLTAASCEPGCWQNCIACTGQNEQAQASNQKVSKPFARHQEALTTALGQENKAQRLLLITHG